MCDVAEREISLVATIEIFHGRSKLIKLCDDKNKINSIWFCKLICTEDGIETISCLYARKRLWLM